MLTTSVVSEAYLPDTSAGLFAAGTVERAMDYRQLESEHSCAFPLLASDNLEAEFVAATGPTSARTRRRPRSRSAS